ncbi:protein containing Serine/threonine protein kinase [Rhodopirellula maiorica SM1]|uniref:non-specific serine/threonine protein kinase n=1 Tax=Rhodopirellula maiorica SM1 TaxID=1265738 RepID=M5R9P4_9BACT|nr:serine/threonine-protein kinase [Rhodopirellula maiorica]EMI16100.1 protein containing Serine/threonine protein kinase [Rhodopirellula maiorica SM1]
MPVATTCLTRDQIQSLIRGSLPPTELQKLTEHIGSCSACQQALQMAATGTLEIESLVANRMTMSPPNDSAYWPAIRSIADADRTALTPDTSASFQPEATTAADSDGTTPNAKKPELSFLEPSDDPAYLGRLDHFQIARVIGRGGMGIVLEAFDTHLQRSVAIKVLNPEFAKNDTARQRFCREGRAAAAISHEHVVSMYQVARESDGKIAYLVMQLIDGETLESRMMRQSPLAASEVARMGMQIAAGLSAAHGRGMVHRDIKPANVLIEKETERIKLTDFGLARAADDVKLTKTGMVTGTPLYMSPEQAMGSDADEKSDLFSFGVVLYEMATGKSPFQAPSIVGVMKKVMDESPEPPHRVNSSIPRKLSDVIMALLEKKPDDRPESIHSVATVLAGIVTEFGPISPLQVPAIKANDAKRLSGKHRTIARRVSYIAVAIAAIGLITLGAVLGGWIFTGEPATATNTPSTDDARFPSVLLSGNPGTVLSVDFVPGKEQVAAAIEDGSIRIWDIQNQKVIKNFNAHRGLIWMVHYHPTRPIFATSGDDGFVKLWDANTYQMIREWKAPNAVRGIAFSPDGSRIVAGDREGTIHLYDIDSGEQVGSKTQSGAIFGVDYSSDGKWIATVGTDKTVRVWDASSLEERQSFTGHKGPIYDVAFIPDGSLLASAGWGKVIHLWNVDTGQEVAKLTGSQSDILGVTFCNFGSHLITSGQDGITRIWDISDGHEVAKLGGHESSVHNVSLDSENHRIASSGRDGNIRIWDLSVLSESK